MSVAHNLVCGSKVPIPAVAGIGLRFPHHNEFRWSRPAVGWVEVHSENYLHGQALSALDAIRRDYPVSLHSIGLSLGSAAPPDRGHLARLVALADHIEPGLISEHVAWGAVDHDFLSDLLPLPLTEESLDAVRRNVDIVQSSFNRQILMENPSTYLQFRHSTIPESEFLTALVARTGCGLICDINNIVVSAANHGWDPESYLRALPVDAIGEFHLAGHGEEERPEGRLLLDTHDRAVSPAAWSLFETALKICGARPTLIERDADIPPLPVLLAEAMQAQAYLDAHPLGPRHALAA